MKKFIAVSASLTLLGLVGISAIAADEFPSSFINVHANSSTFDITDNEEDIRSIRGTAGGADVHISTDHGLMLDIAYDIDQISRDGDRLRITRGTAGLGYIGDVGLQSKWFIEGMASAFQLKLNSTSNCGGLCSSVTYVGPGIKGGFIWPIAAGFFATLDGGAAYLPGRNGGPAQAQGIVGASLGYKFDSNLSLSIGAQENAITDAGSEDSSDRSTLSVTSLQAGISYHF